MNPPTTFALNRTDTAMQAAWLVGAWAWAMSMYLGTQSVPWAVGAGVAAVLPLFALGQRLYKVRLESDSVVIHRTWGRSIRIAYAQLVSVELRRGMAGGSLTLGQSKGPFVTIPGGVDGLDDLAAELNNRRQAAGAAAGEPATAAPAAAPPLPLGDTRQAPAPPAGGRFTPATALGCLLMLAWSALVAAAMFALSTQGRFDLLLAAFASGFAAPATAYVLVRSRRGPAAGCFPAAQLGLWLAGPALVWAFTATAPLGAFTLLGWLTAGYAAAAAISPLLPMSRTSDGQPRRSRAAGAVIIAASAAAFAAWAAVQHLFALPVDYRGAFNPPEELAADDATPLPAVTEVRNGRWLTLAGANSGKALIGRLSPADLSDPTFDDWTFQTGGKPLGVAWSPDGSAAAVLFGEGGGTVDAMRLSAVEMIWWAEPQPIRTLRVFRSPAAARHLVWSPDGRQMRLQVSREGAGVEPAPPRIYRFQAGGDSGSPEMTLEDDDLRLRAVAPDGRLVFDRTDRDGNWFAEVRDPALYRDPDAPRKPVVGPEPPRPPAKGVERFKLPFVGRRVADSPDGRFLVLRLADRAAVGVYDFAERTHFELPDPTGGTALPELPFGIEPVVHWSGDGRCVLIPPLLAPASAGTAVVFDLGRRKAHRIDVPVAGRAVAWSLSADGSRAAVLAQAGSIASISRPLERAPEPDEADGQAKQPQAPRAVEFLPLQRAIFLVDVSTGRMRTLPLLPPAAVTRADAGAAFLWPDNESALYVVLRRPRRADAGMRVFRVELPK